jgi:hypothetical protein
LNFRQDSLSAYDAACKTTTKKISVLDKMRVNASIKQSVVDNLIEELTASKKLEVDTKDIMKNSSDVLKSEIERYRLEKSDDVEGMIDIYVESQIKFANQLLDSWSSFQ